MKFAGVICFLVIGAFAMTTQAESEYSWRRLPWNAEPAWESSTGAWRAVVSESRGRLIYLGRASADENVLHAPPHLENPQSWGGHRLWLGPQNTWKLFWPPPADWESSAAAKVEVDGDTLRLTMPHTDPDYPAFTREYRWEKGRLICDGSWVSGESLASYQIIHILQLPGHAVVTAHAQPREDLPSGFAVLSIVNDHQMVIREPPESPRITREENRLTIRLVEGAEEKIGLPPQPLLAEVNGVRIRLLRGVTNGKAVAMPDDGLLTQVYTSEVPRAPLVEIEQLSPLLVPVGSEKRAGFAIEIELSEVDLPARPTPGK